MIRFVVEVDEKEDSEIVQANWLNAIKENLDYSDVNVREYNEPWDEVPLDRMLNQLTNYMRRNKDSGLVKDWARVILKDELKNVDKN